MVGTCKQMQESVVLRMVTLEHMMGPNNSVWFMLLNWVRHHVYRTDQTYWF